MTLTSARPVSGARSDVSQFREGMDAVENQPVSADWLAANRLPSDICVMCNALFTNKCFSRMA